MRAHYGPTVSVPIGKSDTRLRDITIARTTREITASSPSQNADRTERTSNWDRHAYLSRCLDKVSVAKQEQMVTLARDATGRDPGDGLAAVAALGGLLDVLEALHVERARRSGWSWEAIAQKLGVSRQAVHQKHGDLDKRKQRLGKRGR